MQLLIIIAVIFVLYLIFRSKGHVQVDSKSIQNNVRKDVHTASTYTRSTTSSALSTSASLAERIARKIEPKQEQRKQLPANTK